MDQKKKEEIYLLHEQVCKGLSDPTRMIILFTLAENPRSVTELSQALELPQPTISRHLKILRERNLVAADRDRHSIIYRLGDQRIIQALDIFRDFMGDNLRSRAEIVNTPRQSNS
jgi:DNA-binding transcriptional ArsR family regulator